MYKETRRGIIPRPRTPIGKSRAWADILELYLTAQDFGEVSISLWSGEAQRGAALAAVEVARVAARANVANMDWDGDVEDSCPSPSFFYICVYGLCTKELI